jgi:hypothetical protein
LHQKSKMDILDLKMDEYNNQTIKKSIRKLFADHGIAKVNNMFHEAIQEDFEALQAIVGKGKKEIKIKEEVIDEVKEVVVPKVQQPVIVVDKETPKKTVKKMKKVVEEVMEEDFIDGLVAAPHRITNTTQVVVTKLREGEEDNVPANMTTKELREWQKEQEGKKHAELVSQGIDSTTLLTMDNLKKWVEEEKKSYSYIARRLVGLPEAQVSAEAKKHGIISEIAKRRLAVIASRKGK